MADTGAPWNLPYPLPTDLVRDGAQAIQDLAEATATGLSLAGNAGIGPNVVQTVKTDGFTTTSSSYVDVTGVNVTITPSSNTSKVLVTVTGVIANSSDSGNDIQLVRGSTAIAVGTGGSTGNATTGFNSGGVGTNPYSPFAIEFLDSPATTAATTYKVQVARSAGTLFIGRNQTGSRNFVTVITAIEVAA